MTFAEIAAALTALSELGKIGEAEVAWLHSFAESAKAKAIAHANALETAPAPTGSQPEE